ncbi:ABC transporter permease [Paenibacillus sp. ACRRX]|uniref:ABC transporter permease n=1 Tax=unclassified Paenibacillus TaxID=185978 RepID=UPI001EF3E642|nr:MULTISPECIES: ABC transporter permease [unclassified Paenibacillus]MCG7408605.1 ABC transporter permease [Paenibacillus sp. ACRRX]MDK8182850.1 ABC transporter permease [Paenibacillus sp. UMB4589-SE434]
MRNLGTVIGFTLRTKMMTKAFIVTTIILALIMTIGVNVPYLISLFSKDEPMKIGVMQGNYPVIEQSLEKSMAEQKNKDLMLVSYPNTTEAQLKKDIEAGNIDGYLKLEKQGEGATEQFPKVIFTGTDSLGMSKENVLMSTLTLLKTKWVAKGALSEEQFRQLNEPVSFESVKVQADGESKDPEKEDANKGVSAMVVMVLIVLFFMTNQMTGNMIASEVTQEKSSRIMEILITSVSPLAQMFGKIIGMFLLGLIQIVVFLVVVLANLMLPHNIEPLKDMNFDISMIDPAVVGLGLLLYVLGYFLYATLYAAVGSIVSRTEDLGQAIMPIALLSMVAFYIPIFSISAPNTMLVKVASYIPFFTPTTMLLRIGVGEYAWWELAVSIAILLVSVLLFGYLAAKIYRTGVLMYGKRPSWKEIRKAMKAYKI